MSAISHLFQEKNDLFSQRLGLFIHWGIYALPGYHEQQQQRQAIPRSEYGKLSEQFCPHVFDPDHWVDLARNAGMEYIVLTTKHHDGFCLWKTDTTRFAVNHSACGIDIVGQVSEACARKQMRFGVYYSCVDWHHPNYPNQGRHHELKGPEAGDRPDMEAYLDYVRAQVRELCDGRYGKISVFWWDMNVPEYQDPSVNKLIRELQPDCLINNRGFGEGDFSTPEREADGDRSWEVYPRRVEACNSIDSQAWGFRNDPVFYTLRHLQAAICKYVSRGGNYLINVGPDASGRITPSYAERVTAIGKWFKAVREGLVEVEPIKPLPLIPSQIVTRRSNNLYLQLVNIPPGEGVCLKPISIAPRRATLLNSGEPISWEIDCLPYEPIRDRDFLRLRLPSRLFWNEVSVIKLEFDADPFAGHRDDEEWDLAMKKAECV
jgi:alpha-L-fucosidase